MKRLCLMALSLVLFSFSAFAWGGINNNNEVLIGGSPRVFPDEVNVGETAACLKDITLVATKTYVRYRVDRKQHLCNQRNIRPKWKIPNCQWSEYYFGKWRFYCKYRL